MGFTMSSAAAAAAAARRKRDHEEEEEVTPMNTDPSGTVEYKIIRSSVRSFKNPAVFRQALQDEAVAGWELVEKLDDSRVRLRRPLELRKNDHLLTQDPYRIQVGLSETALVLRILLGVFLVIGAIVGIVTLVKG